MIFMKLMNIEIKARCKNPEFVKEILKTKNADFRGLDHQIDTYFKINSGRLKLREGNIENSLVFYKRKNKKGPKQSDVILFKTKPNSLLKEILTKTLDILVVVDKQREIYYIDNVKFHVDNVKDLGTFVEIEVIKESGMTKNELLEQCQYYSNLFKVSEKDLIPVSYSDLLLKKESGPDGI